MNAVHRAYVYGSKSFARAVTALAMECRVDVLGFIDDFASPDVTAGSFSDLSAQHAGGPIGILMGVGYTNLAARWALWRRVREAGWRTPILVHPRAHVAATSRLGAGTLVMAGALVDHHCEIGEACVLWPQACVNHDCSVGANCFLSPQTLLCGHVRLGAHSFVGAQAAVVDHAQLPEGSFLRMGSCFTTRPA